MGKMMQYSPEGGARLEAVLESRNWGAEKRAMFGHQAWFLNGYMFCGANVMGIYVHLGEDAVRTALGSGGDVSPFVPREGMTMKDYLQLGPTICADEEELLHWLRLGRDHLAARPPKAAGKRR